MLTKHSISKPINITEYTRPIKILYIVPYKETRKNHLILDAVFYDSYTRWSGAAVFVIPANKNGFLYEMYDEWFENLDPDFVCSYVELTQTFIKKISKLCNPILISVEDSKYTSKDSFRRYLKDWQRVALIQPLSSLSLVSATKQYFEGRELGKANKILVEIQPNESNRFISDNFGCNGHQYSTTQTVLGLFNVVCLNPYAKDGYVSEGTELVKSYKDVLSRIGSREINTFLDLSVSYSTAIPKVNINNNELAFNVFLGDTCIDRINFWNSRCLTQDRKSSIILSKNQYSDDDFLKLFGEFLNSYNERYGHNNQREVEVRSLSINLDERKEFARKLGNNTRCMVWTNEKSSREVSISRDNFGKLYTSVDVQSSHYQTTKKESNGYVANDPYHFKYISPHYDFLKDGDWMVELEIEREKDLSRYDNVTHVWMLPIRENSSKIFTSNLSRVTKNHIIALIPSRKDRHNFFKQDIMRSGASYQLSFPSDESYFSCIVTNYNTDYFPEDPRAKLRHKSYERIGVSSKGKYMRGIIRKIGSLYKAYYSLTRKLWRDCIRKEAVKEDLKFASFNGLLETALGDSKFRKKYQNKYNASNDQQVKSDIKKNFFACSNLLLQQKVIYKVHPWVCDYCGTHHVCSVDNLKFENTCTVCGEIYHVPYSIEWRFQIDAMIINALHRNNGLTVLWMIGYISTQDCRVSSFYYMPEVDLFNSYKDKERSAEIDLICVVDGLLYIGEAKQTAALFLKKKKDKKDEEAKFIEIIKKIKPDVALLAFERYSDLEEDTDKVRTKLIASIERMKKICGDVDIRYIVAEEVDEGFNEFLCQ
ncbi:TPA: hypothetical protein JD772_002681, partial [Legionella pneumophila]|nr:hypothetical protein [Legionella pneumophila]